MTKKCLYAELANRCTKKKKNLQIELNAEEHAELSDIRFIEI